jgi:hypothetical protein
MRATQVYAAFGGGSEAQLLLIPFEEFSKWLDGMNETTNGLIPSCRSTILCRQRRCI